MNKPIFFVIICCIILLIYFNQQEYFDNTPTIVTTYEKQLPLSTNETNELKPQLDMAGKQAVQIRDTYSLLNDPLFKDVIYYENDNLGRLGLDMCIEKCNGYCVEYGITGNAYCFPNSETKRILPSKSVEILK